MRIDKYDPKSGGFRAALNADQVATPDAIGGTNPGWGAELTNAGRVVKAGNASGQNFLVGVVVLTKDMKAGDIVDVMTDGDIVECGGTAGTRYTVDMATGVIGTTAEDATHVYIGHTVEAGRLVVRLGRETG